jgi:calpain-15
VKGGPVFSRAHGNEMWVLLLEKAYAKLHGNYYTLRGGYASEGMTDLTGNPTECYDFEDPIAAKKGYMLSASTPGEDLWTENGGAQQDGGLVMGHAYSIITVVKTKEGV